MRTTSPRFLVLGLILLAGPAVGCNSGPADCDVSGTVTLNGAPLPEGEISFVSDDPKVPVAAGPVKNGSYRLSVKAGKKTVRVYSRQAVPGTNPPMYNESLPGRYNAQSTLTAEVAPRGDNKFAFALTLP